MFSVRSNDQFLTKRGVFTFEGIQKAYQEESPYLAEYICKMLILNPAPRQMFIEQERGTPTFANFSTQISEAVTEQKVLLANTERAKTKSGKVSPIYSIQFNWRAHKKVWDHITSEAMIDLLPDRMLLYEVIIDLWNNDSVYARTQLLDILRHARLKYGVWRAIKTIFKEAEVRMDWEVYAILNTRFSNRENGGWGDNLRYIWITPQDQAAKEAEMATIREQEEEEETINKKIDKLESIEELTTEQEEDLQSLYNQKESHRTRLEEVYRNANLEPHVVDWSDLIEDLEVRTQNNYGDYEPEQYNVDPSAKTIGYLRRRVRRTFRQLAKDFPSAFPAAAAEMLMLSSSTSGYYSISNLAQDFIMSSNQRHLWLNQQAPLLKIVEQSNNSKAVQWAYGLLKKEYRLEMKEVSPKWLYRISQSKYDFTHKQALDYLQNVTGVEEGGYHEKGYHKTIIGFLGLDRIQHGNAEIDFAISYLQSAGANPENTWLTSELPLDEICRLLRSDNSKLRDLGMHLLEGNEGKSAYEDAFDLEFFTMLLKDSRTFQFASKQIRKRYTSLLPEWYIDLLLTDQYQVRSFANELLKDTTMVAADADWSDFCKTLFSNVTADRSVYESAWRRLTQKHSDGSKLIENKEKIPMEFIRWLFIHPSSYVRSLSLSVISEEIRTLQDVGIEFLKILSTKREYKAHLQTESAFEAFVGSFISDVKTQYLRDEVNGYSDDIGERVRTWLPNEFTLLEVGLEWCFERIQWWSSQYSFVRTLFKRDVNFEQLGELLPQLSKDEFKSNDPVVNGARQVAWYIYHKCLDASSKKANFYKSLLLERNLRNRKSLGLSDLENNMLMPPEAFDFSWFLRWAGSKREPIRQYALQMARFEMSYWIEQGNVGFKDLQPLFTGFYDVQEAIVKAIYNPPPDVNQSRIDLKRDSFLPQELYVYCFGLDERPRDFALQVILDFPNRFGQPQDLLSLSDVKSYKVRQVVVQVLWKLYKNPDVTPDWKPFKYSVVPFSLSRDKDPLRETLVDPNKLTLSPDQVKSTQHYLGLGSASQLTVNALSEDSKFDLHEFLRRFLYALPRDPEKSTAEEAAREERMRRKFGGGAKKKTPLNSSWQNKKTLVAAIRDLAIKDRDFAVFVLPVLEEFKSVRGKLLHNACLTALVQIKNTHQI